MPRILNMNCPAGRGAESGLPIKADFSDGVSLVFSIDYLSEELLSEGKLVPDVWKADRELTPGEEEAFRFAALCYRAETAALRLISRAEQHSFGLTAKLERKGIDARAAKTAVSRLLERGLLDDERFAELWIRSRLSGAPSPKWLQASLGKRGVDRHSSSRALKKTLDPETEYALLLRYLQKTGLGGAEKDGAPKAGFLRARLRRDGFSPGILNRYFDE